MELELTAVGAREEKFLVNVLSYPSPSIEIMRMRLVELAMLGVKRIILGGRVLLGRVPVLGKGTTSIVVKGVHACKGIVTIKVRRIDSNRRSMLREAKLLKIANSVGVGPHLVAASRNFVVWEFVDGEPLEVWLSKVRDRNRIRRVVRGIVMQAYQLDKIGLAHRQLSRVKDHILVTLNDKPIILEFACASMTSKKSNVTQVLQALLISNRLVSPVIREALGLNIADVVETLRKYKRNRDIECLITALKL